ncbi:hypothetical protein EYF80_047903 [Liparis tanakae]|uniref:Uncharacterized protein n=1 Tax=Liparis tanakae TaxID=230148 RepID=A0A4Z2FM08_9TELE|nr:hypothetical protein EYF80_047903 [Liparis tanakae]
MRSLQNVPVRPQSVGVFLHRWSRDTRVSRFLLPASCFLLPVPGRLSLKNLFLFCGCLRSEVNGDEVMTNELQRSRWEIRGRHGEFREPPTSFKKL